MKVLLIAQIWSVGCLNSKKQQLITDLASEMVFGKLLARTHSIEFQKRGYPHVHVIIWVDMDCVRHLGPETIGKTICAEIPNEYKKQEIKDKDQPRTKNSLHKPVTSFMLHGPHNPLHEERILSVRLSKRVLS